MQIDTEETCGCEEGEAPGVVPVDRRGADG